MPAPSESLRALPRNYAGGQPLGTEGNPKVILLVTFADWAKNKFVTYALTKVRWTDRLDGRNSDLDLLIGCRWR